MTNKVNSLQPFSSKRTSFDDFSNSCLKDMCHVTHHGEYDKASKKACTTVDKGHNKRVSVEEAWGFEGYNNALSFNDLRGLIK